MKNIKIPGLYAGAALLLTFAVLLLLAAGRSKDGSSSDTYASQQPLFAILPSTLATPHSSNQELPQDSSLPSSGLSRPEGTPAPASPSNLQSVTDHNLSSASGASASSIAARLTSPASSESDKGVTQSVYGSKTGSAKKRPPAIPVLNYHSVRDIPGNIVVIREDRFREQMQYLHDEGYTTLSMAEFTGILEGSSAPPPKPVLLTFDDGYTDNYTAVTPILLEFGFRATLFMSPGMVDMEGYLNWDQVREMAVNGWDILPHGMTHPSLTKLSLEEQTREITEARRLIEEEVGVTADIFCYPYGLYDKRTLTILRENGFRYAFTIDQGKTSASQPPLELKRIFVNGEEKLSALTHKLIKW